MNVLNDSFYIDLANKVLPEGSRKDNDFAYIAFGNAVSEAAVAMHFGAPSAVPAFYARADQLRKLGRSGAGYCTVDKSRSDQCSVPLYQHPFPEVTDQMVEAGFAELESRGFRTSASDLGSDDIKALFNAMLSCQSKRPPADNTKAGQ